MNVSFIDATKKYDFSFLLTACAIFLIGVLNLYSATHSDPSAGYKDLYKVQLMWFSISMALGALIGFLHPKNLYRGSYFLFGFNILLLFLVLTIGTKAYGAQRWLVLGPFRFQPSEIMKITVVLALARWFSRNEPDTEIGLKRFIPPFLIALIPATMIIIQPDLGTGLLILLIFSVMVFYRQLKPKTLFLLVLFSVISGSIMYQFGLKEYQKKRILTFIDPHRDARGSGYNAIQSEIAIGSGRLFGKGFKKSSQASLNYLPENHTDFVFSVFNEEHGFFGSLVLITLYGVLLFRFLWLSSNCLRFYDALVSVGLMSIFFWHIFVNMCMVMGLMPVVGLPLPLMSYGGSSLLTFGICCGLATSISNSRNIF